MASRGASRIASMRYYRALEQRELARLAGMSRAKLQELEARTREPKLADLVNIAIVLRCRLDDVIDDDQLAFRSPGAGVDISDAVRTARLEATRTDWQLEEGRRIRTPGRVTQAYRDWVAELEARARESRSDPATEAPPDGPAGA